MADLLVTRPGDAIFPWVVAGDGSPNRGFSYEFEVAGSPIFVPGDSYPLKLPVRSLAERWTPPLEEAEALDLFGGGVLWNAIGKKSLQRGRSFTHQTLAEDALLRNKLTDRQGVKHLPETLALARSNNSLNLSVDIEAGGNVETAIPTQLGAVDLKAVNWTEGQRFCYEKGLEAWLVERIDKGPVQPFWNLALDLSGELIWFGNYLPFGVAGGSIDLLTIHKNDAQDITHIATVVELKAGGMSVRRFKSAANQVIRYASFVRRAFSAFNIMVQINPVVLSGPSNPQRLTQLSSPTFS